MSTIQVSGKDIRETNSGANTNTTNPQDYRILRNQAITSATSNATTTSKWLMIGNSDYQVMRRRSQGAARPERPQRIKARRARRVRPAQGGHRGPRPLFHRFFASQSGCEFLHYFVAFRVCLFGFCACCYGSAKMTLFGSARLSLF